MSGTLAFPPEAGCWSPLAGTWGEVWGTGTCPFWAASVITLLEPANPVLEIVKVNTMLVSIKAIARTVVARERNEAAPRPPKTALEMLEPPKAPANPSPFADCNSTVIISVTQTKICKVNKIVYIFLLPTSRLQDPVRGVTAKSLILREPL